MTEFSPREVVVRLHEEASVDVPDGAIGVEVHYDDSGDETTAVVRYLRPVVKGVSDDA